MSTLRVAMDGRSLVSPVLRGWDRYALGLIGELARRGVEVTLIHRDEQPLHAPHVENLGCRSLALQAPRGGVHFEQVVVPRALRRGGFDVYHAPFERGVPLISPCPTVLTVHSVTTWSYVDFVSRGLLPGPIETYLGGTPRRWCFPEAYWRAQVRRAGCVLTPSEFCRDEVIRLLKISPGRVSTTPLALPDAFLRPSSSAEERAGALAKLGVRAPYLLFVGGFEPHKNVTGLLNAFARVHVERADVSLVAVGSRDLPESVARHADGLGLRRGEDVVFLVGLGEELIDLYDGAAAFVSLSWRETFGLPALEALSRGRPVVASAWGATPEVVGEFGRLVDPRHVDDVARAIIEQLGTGDDDVGERRRNWARGFSWTHTADLTLASYWALLT